MKSPMTMLGRLRHPTSRSGSKGGPSGKTPTLGEAFAPEDFTSVARWPSMDLSEDDKEVMVKVEAPGLSEKDMRITYSDGVLRIEGEKKEDKEETRRGTYYRESRYGSFSRNVPIDPGVDWDKARAEFKQGILKVVLPKTPGMAGRKNIPIG